MENPVRLDYESTNKDEVRRKNIKGLIRRSLICAPFSLASLCSVIYTQNHTSGAIYSDINSFNSYQNSPSVREYNIRELIIKQKKNVLTDLESQPIPEPNAIRTYKEEISSLESTQAEKRNSSIDIRGNLSWKRNLSLISPLINRASQISLSLLGLSTLLSAAYIIKPLKKSN